MSPDRREFLKLAGAQAGLLAAASRTAEAERRAPAVIAEPSPDVVVIGAGAFGGWTAFNLQKRGAKVTLVDAWGPGNSRSTSGDETRGVRSSYGNSPFADIWVPWARKAMVKWREFDEEWGGRMGAKLFYKTGDLIFREQAELFTDRSMEWWKKLKIPFSTPSVDDVLKEYPVFRLDKISVVVHEPDAGVVRARRACQVVADALERSGGKIVIGHASLGQVNGRQLESVQLAAPFGFARGAIFVFALGPWFPKFFPTTIGNLIRTPMGHVHYFGTPPADDRFTYPNLPSWNFRGVTGWAALPSDSRGFRVRWQGDRQLDPDVSNRAFERKHDKPARKLLKEHFPLLKDAPLLETRACHYEFSAAGNFLFDRHPDFDNVWLAGAGSAEGFKFGPVVGEYVAGRVMGDPSDPDIAETFSLKAAQEADKAAK